MGQANNSPTSAAITFAPGLSGTIDLNGTLALQNTFGQPITIDGSGASIAVNGQNTIYMATYVDSAGGG